MTEPAAEEAPRGAKLLAGRIGGVAGSLAIGQLLVGVTYIVAARSMDPAGLGLVATCFAIGTIGATVFDMGLTLMLVRDVAAGTTTMQQARALVSAKRRLLPLLLIPTVAASLLIMPNPVEGIVLGVIGWLIWEALAANALLRTLEQFTRAASAQLAGRALGLVSTTVLVFLIAPELALAIGLAASFAAEAVIDLVFLGASRTKAASMRVLLTTNRKSLSYGFGTLSSTGQQLDQPLVSLGGGAAAGGIYAAAGRLLGPLLFLSSALALVGAPWLARAQNDPDALRAEERRISRFALVLAAAPLAAAAVGPLVIPWLLGAEYEHSGTTFTMLAIGAAISTVSQGMAITLQNRRVEHAVSIAIAIGLVLGLIATYVLAAAGGAVWAAAGYTLSQLYIVIHLAVVLHRVRARG